MNSYKNSVCVCLNENQSQWLTLAFAIAHTQYVRRWNERKKKKQTRWWSLGYVGIYNFWSNYHQVESDWIVLLCAMLAMNVILGGLVWKTCMRSPLQFDNFTIQNVNEKIYNHLWWSCCFTFAICNIHSICQTDTHTHTWISVFGGTDLNVDKFATHVAKKCRYKK